jgi:Flp pilus assembly pilin Flp
MSKRHQARPAPARPAHLGRLLRRESGQTTSEYLTLSGVIAVIVIAGMTMFTAPVARTFIVLFRRSVLYLTSTSP